MNSAVPPDFAPIGLPPELFAAAFPFHFILDRQLRVVVAGSSLSRLCPDILSALSCERTFRLLQPPEAINWDFLERSRGRFLVLQHLATGLQFCGEFVLHTERGVLIFLGTPWFQDADEIAEGGRYSHNFAEHNSVVDRPQVYQASQSALADTHQKAEKAIHQRVELREVSERLLEQSRLNRTFMLIASRMKYEFLAHMSHEFRTPMNAILGYTQLLLRDPDLPGPARTQVEIIHRSGEGLLGLLNSILELSKIEAGRVQVQPVTFNLSACLEDLVCLFRERAEMKCLALLLELDPDLPRFIAADEEKIRQILANLLSNALKFTERGEVRLKCAVRPNSNGDPRLWLEVQDTGIGISPDELPLLFESFSPAAAGRRLGHGAGLGLALSRQLARVLGGEITVKSQLGSGSTFYVELPFAAAGAAECHQKPAKELRMRLPAGFPPCLVFVVDDLQVNQNLLKHILKPAGFSVQMFSSGPEMLAAMAQSTPQLVLMDTRMPDMDGYETIRRLRALPGGATAKVITISAAAFAEDRKQSSQAGADDFIAKPFSPDELLAKIASQLQLHYSSPSAVPINNEETELHRLPLPAGALAAVPLDIRQQLQAALQIGDYAVVNQLVARIQNADRRLGTRLARLAEQFDAETLLQWLAEAADIKSP